MLVAVFMKDYFHNMSFASASRVRMVVAVKSVSLLGEQIAAVVLALRLQAQGAGPGWLAAVLVIALLPSVALAPLVGRLADRFDARWLLVLSGFGQAAACVLLAPVTSVGTVLGLVALLGTGQAVNGTTWKVLLARTAAPEALPAALGLSQAGAIAASIGAPALAGLLTGAAGGGSALLSAAGAFLVVTVATPWLAPRTRGIGSGAADVPQAARATGRIRHDPLLRLLLGFFAAFATLGAMVNVVDVYLVRGTLHASATWYGIAAATGSLGMLGGALGAGRLRGSTQLAAGFVSGAALLAIAMCATAAVPNVAWLMPASLLLGIGNGLLNVGLGALVLARVPEQMRGRITATMGAVASAALIVAYLLGGALGTLFPPRLVFLLAGALGLVVPVLAGRPLLRAAAAPSSIPQPVPVGAGPGNRDGC
jgi:MFS family permease